MLLRFRIPEELTRSECSSGKYFLLNREIIAKLIDYGKLKNETLEATFSVTSPAYSGYSPTLRVYKATMRDVHKIADGDIELKGNPNSGLTIEGFEIIGKGRNIQIR